MRNVRDRDEEGVPAIWATRPMYWISLDLDWLTGDCRGLNDTTACVKIEAGCTGCIGEVGRGKPGGYTIPRPEEAVPIKEWLMELDIRDVIVRDSHGDIFQYLEPGDFVYNIDEHTDDYDPRLSYEVHCGNWVNYCDRDDIKVMQHVAGAYPKLDEQVRMFVAVSRPYTSTDMDGWLFELLIDLRVPVDLYGGA